MRMTGYTADDLPDLSGRTAVVTGASSGLGAATARGLAAAGAHVVLAVRDAERGERVAAEIAGSSEVRRLDLANLASVRAFAAAWSGELDILVNNAGVMAVPFSRTADGFECQMGTNHLGHFALTLLLLPHITDRVVTVSSGIARFGRIDLDDLSWQRRRYGAWRAYAQSKRANLLFTHELDRRLLDAESTVRAIAAHPGIAGTRLQRRTGRPLRDIVARATCLLGGDAANGALPTLYAATGEIPGGLCVGPDARATTRHAPVVGALPRFASDPEVARRLFDLSAAVTGTDVDQIARARGSIRQPG
jgi:NAD(P)-dependent dehydrogenase (short-subunit alcohol dehydrogenase family)